MESTKPESTGVCHVVAVPYPGRGHINPMMNLCKLLCSKSPDILITFVVTEEWFGFIGSDNKPANVCFRTIPNVIPSELVRAKDFTAFLMAVLTKMEAPFEELLDRLEPPVTAIIADTYVDWTVEVGKRRNIPVASLWTMSASVLSVFHHFNLLVENQHFPADLSEQGNERVDYIPGLTPMLLADLPTIFYQNNRQTLKLALDCVSSVPKSQYLLFTSVYELEFQVIDAFRAKLPFPVYTIGPSIPYLDLKENFSKTTSPNGPDYLQWLDLQPKGSVLYVSLGSFLSVSAAQIDEIIGGVQDSGVRYLWVSRGDSSKFKDCCGGRQGLVIPWSDQLRVLSHSSIGGFWTHCGWNSTLEAVYAGVPMLTFPIFWDQVPNSKQIVEDWKIGWRAKKNKVGEHLVMRQEIADLVRKFMDFESNEGKEMRRNAGKLRESCQIAIAKGGSSDINVDSFIKDILERHTH
ncbi:hypothetical protein PTKIN_Ptkin11bG0004200 [Pterospermum kingtungense]